MEGSKLTPPGKNKRVWHRCQDQTPLASGEINSLKNEIRSIGAEESVFAFNESVGPVRYDRELDKVYVTRNVFPDTSIWPDTPYDLLTPRALLAYEYYGRRLLGYVAGQYWQHDALAAISAALNTPGLTQYERGILLWEAAWHAAIGYCEFMLTDDLKAIAYGTWERPEGAGIMAVDGIKFVYKPELRNPPPYMSGACIPESRGSLKTD